MRILFCLPSKGNYVTDGLFHGLRTILGDNCVDVPRCDIMYSDMPAEKITDTGNNGFYLYGQLTDNAALQNARLNWQRSLSKFDFFIIGNIWSQWDTFVDIFLHVPAEKIVIIDGEDTASFFPFDNIKHQFKTLDYRFISGLSAVKYYKRELDVPIKNGTIVTTIAKRLGVKALYNAQNVRQISMSIPESVIEFVDWSDKKKDFVDYIVDSEVGQHLNNVVVSVLGDRNHKFLNEEEYTRDLKNSRFGITAKRAGWDCFRHYEYAAKGTILCFKSLNLKPKRCAPHDLDAQNCIIYKNYNDLNQQIKALSENDLRIIQKNAYDWIWRKTTTAVAADFLRGISNQLVSDFYVKSPPLSILK